MAPTTAIDRNAIAIVFSFRAVTRIFKFNLRFPLGPVADLQSLSAPEYDFSYL